MARPSGPSVRSVRIVSVSTSSPLRVSSFTRPRVEESSTATPRMTATNRDAARTRSTVAMTGESGAARSARSTARAVIDSTEAAGPARDAAGVTRTRLAASTVTADLPSRGANR